jgi:hypothetical protein
MSYSSVYTVTSTNPALAKNIISSNVGGIVTITSFSAGGNLPVAPAPLVSGNQYTFCDVPFPNGAGTYLMEINFDITGDNTTAFSYIKTAWRIGGIAGGVLLDTDFLVGTTLPDATAISQSYSAPYGVSASTAVNTLAITFTPTFVGTAPTITATYLKFYKLT